ncbi:MAG: PKD domain-containing protein, partial [Micrococcales bacterium]|nr:PKD domain-containing protein [Micrococcales bacterium]
MTHFLSSRILRRGVALAVTLAVASVGALAVVTGSADPAEAASLPSPVPVSQRDPSVVTADPLPTIQLDSGYVWAQTMVGNTVYAVGSFSNARAAGTAAGQGALTSRANALAYDIVTGQLTSWAPTVNGVVKAITASPDGSRIYLGGSFNQVNGQTRYNFAAVDAATGALIPGVTPSIGGTGVYALTATASVVYVGGLFTQANATPRGNLAAFSTSNGALLGWAPTTDQQVDAMVMDPSGSKVIVGGRFYLVNSAVQRGLAALDLANGAILPWAAPATVVNGWNTGQYAGKAGIFGLNADSGGVYGTGWVYANATVGNLEGVFAAESGTGDIRWVADCHGDSYGVFSTGSVVYSTSHTHACETVGLWPEQNPRTYRYAQAFSADARGTLTRSATAGDTYKDWSGTPSPGAYAWYPDFTVGTASGLGQAGLSITGNTQYISIGGEFTSVNNKQFYGLVRFAVNPSTGAKQGPRLSGSNWTGTATSKSGGTVHVSIPSNWDRDDLQLTYSLYRQGVSSAVATVQSKSTWWDTPPISFTDTGVPPGTTQQYTVVATDPAGNKATSAPIPVTVSSAASAAYGEGVLSDGATTYWRLGDDQTDWTGAAAPNFGSGVAATSGAIASEPANRASVFDGTGSGIVASPAKVPASTTRLSVSAWIKTTTRSGGKIVGYGSSASGQSNSYDRHLYMQDNGQVTFGVYNGTTNTVTSPTALNDGQWHQVVATLSPTEGLRLYVDGQLASSNTGPSSAEAFSGYWRVGGDNLNGWPGQPSSAYFAGAIDDVSVYPGALTDAQVLRQYGLANGIASPSAEFSASTSALTVNVDGSGSSAPTGRTVTGYSWNWGDGTASGSGANSTHSYAASGTYTVVLTVTDSAGFTGTTSRTVTVTAPNAPPAASFTSSADGLTLSVDGRGSADSDGTVASYSWNWGDGTAAGSGPTATHRYATAGTYSVTLTVTDDKGATGSSTSASAVSHAAPIASFTKSPSGVAVGVDGSASTASDGATLAYSWNWGDGSAAGSGASATHAYATAGTYTLTLTVTDSLGATASSSAAVTVSGASAVASDDFGRSV